MGAETSILAAPGPSSRSRTQVLDVLGVVTVVLVFIATPSRFETEQWWLGPLVVMAWGWALWRRKSFWGKPIILFGLFLLLRGHRAQQRKKATTEALAALPAYPANSAAGPYVWDAEFAQSP